MPRIQNSIIICKDPQTVFDITNDIERWPILFNEYHGAKILNRESEGRYTRLSFQLTNAEGNTWRSQRLLDHQQMVATAEREEPLYPFAYMHLKWTCEAAPEGTKMTWTQDFELDPKYPDPLPVVLDRMNAHTVENQQNIKEKIESGQAEKLTAEAMR
ncbi:putative polyketide cyclase [Ktedonobacter sp. SOSP1-85]|uniref:SRPBCC family protein n=1 Tax=Ktedonobacter sp. SOSP1-85 TaxID=2778367 RepID=UPI0019160C81|nr:SRPBCC family protein [Ktedonobacter sp. SOSP1-85]GHO81094.1 putative polyketide cyclase [Ktedonobacter sp. SOSP1-85]